MTAPRARPFFSWRQALLNSALEPMTRHVLLTLSTHMNDAGESCYPSIKTLARETGLSRPSVIKAIRAASAAGWLSVRQHGFAHRSWKRNEYAIAWPEDVLDKVVNGVDHHVANGRASRSTAEHEAVNPVDREAVNPVDLSTPSNSPRTQHVSAGGADVLSKRKDDDLCECGAQGRVRVGGQWWCLRCREERERTESARAG